MKAVILLILGIATLTTLTSCSTNDNSTKSNNSKSTSISSTAENNSYTPFILNDNTIYPSSFVVNENSVVFTNWEENNRISIINDPFPNGLISSTNIADFHNHTATSLISANNLIYFGDTSNSSNLASINLTDKTYTKLNNRHVHDITTINNKELFYLDIPEKDTNSRKLYRYDIEDKNDTLITSDNIGKYIINNNFILYQNLSDGSKLYKISTTGKDKEKITDYSIDSIAIFSSQIFVSNSDDNNYLYTIDPSSLDSKRFALFNVTDLKSFNNQVYGIDKSNYLCKLTLSTDSNEVKANRITSYSVNEYYPTEKGIFIQKSINVNNPYFITTNNNQ